MEEMLEQVTALSAVCLGRVESVVNMGLVFFWNRVADDLYHKQACGTHKKSCFSRF